MGEQNYPPLIKTIEGSYQSLAALVHTIVLQSVVLASIYDLKEIPYLHLGQNRQYDPIKYPLKKYDGSKPNYRRIHSLPAGYFWRKS